MKHSPAPWRIVDKPSHSCCFDLGIDDRNGSPVADVIECDAALIAAAPDLLEACKLAVERDLEQVDNVGFGAIGESGRKIILAAIAKAEGNVLTQTETK